MGRGISSSIDSTLEDGTGRVTFFEELDFGETLATGEEKGCLFRVDLLGVDEGAGLGGIESKAWE